MGDGALFVDFDPVRARAEGRDPGLPRSLADLFPTRIVESDNGEVPEGWHVATFGEMVEEHRENEKPLESPETEFHHYSIPAFDAGRSPKIEPGKDIKSQKRRVPPNTVLLSKLNPEIERVWLVDVKAGERSVCSTEFVVLQPRSPLGRRYLYCLAGSAPFRQRLEGLVTGTSKSHQRARVGAILDLEVVRPPDGLCATFERMTAPLLDRKLACHRESRTLGALRDALLPKLISGEVRVEGSHRFIEHATQ